MRRNKQSKIATIGQDGFDNHHFNERTAADRDAEKESTRSWANPYKVAAAVGGIGLGSYLGPRQKADFRKGYIQDEFANSDGSTKQQFRNFSDVISPDDAATLEALETQQNAYYDKILKGAEKAATVTKLHVEVTSEPSGEEAVEVRVA